MSSSITSLKIKSVELNWIWFSSSPENIDDEEFRYFYAQENISLLDRFNFLCTKDDLAKLKDTFIKIDVTEWCSREILKTKWRFYM